MSGSRARISIVLAAVALATAVSGAATAVRVLSPSTGLAFLATPDSVLAGGIEVDPLPGMETSARARDVLVTLAGAAIVSDAALAAAIPDGGPSPGDRIALEVVRDGEHVQLTQLVRDYPALEVLAASTGTLAFCVLLFGVAAFAMARRPRDPAAGALLITSVGALGSTVPFVLGQDPLDLATGAWRVHLAAIGGVYMLLWAGAVHFALAFPRPLAVVERRPWLELAPYAAVYGLPTAMLLLAAAGAGSTVELLGVYAPIQLLVVAGSLGLVGLIMAWRWRRSSTADRRILGAVMVAGAFTIALTAIVWLVPELLTGRPLLPWSVAGLVGIPIPLALGSAILRHRAFDIDVVVRRSLLWGTLSAGVVVTYAIAVTVLGRLFAAEDPFATSLLATGLAAVVVLPLRDLVQQAIDRGLYGDRGDPVRAIRRLGARLEGTLDVDAIPRVVVDTVADALRLPFAALELGPPGAQHRVAERGRPEGPVVELPLVHRSEPVGRLLVTARGAEESLTGADRALLDDLARQAGVAAYAILLTEDLRRSRERIVAAREEERRRLHRDLHDGLGPSLAAIAMRAEAAAALIRTDPERAEPALLELAADARTGVAEVRRLVDGLRPPVLDELGLAGAIRREGDRLGGASGSLEVVVDAEPLGELPAAVEVAAYRIAAEAITNAARHAGAARCVVRIEKDRSLHLEISDDGRGLAGERSAGTGLGSMHERAAELGGELRVETGPSGGTRVIARLPLAATTGGGGVA